MDYKDLENMFNLVDMLKQEKKLSRFFTSTENQNRFCN